MAKRRWAFGVALATATLAGQLYFPSPSAQTPSVGAPVVSPDPVPAGAPVAITVTSRIVSGPLDPPVQPLGVNLLRVAASGQVLGTLGRMLDDGTGGDATAKDGTFTLRATLTVAPGDTLRLRVSAAFVNRPQRILSGISSTPSAPVDTTAPVVAITSPTGGFSRVSTIPVTGTIDDATATVRVNGVLALLANGTFTAGAVALQEGLNALNATATDPAGNVGIAAAQVTLDSLPPSLVITQPTAGSSGTQNPPHLEVAFSDSGSGVAAGSLAWTANGTAFTATCAPATGGASCTPTAPLPFGAITLAATLVDAAGNLAATQTQFTLQTTTTGPLTIAISDPAEGAVVASSPITVRGSVNDPASRVTVQGALASVAGTSFEQPGVTLREGVTHLTARARDPLGRTVVATRAIVLDTVAPFIQLTSPTDRSIVVTSPIAMTGLVTDASAATCTSNGAPIAVGAPIGEGGERRFSGSVNLVAGPNLFAVACRDEAGHETTAPVAVYYDPTPLLVTSVTPHAGAIDVPAATPVTIGFSEPINVESVTELSVFLRDATALIPSTLTVSADHRFATLMPIAPLPAGRAIEVAVTDGVLDASGNPLAQPFESQFLVVGTSVAPGDLAGEVYDDTRSLPLAGARVEVLAAGSEVPIAALVTDDRGRYVASPGRTDVVIRIGKDGFTSAVRELVTSAGAFSEALDARLTPLAASQIATEQGRAVTSRGGDLLTIPAGAIQTTSSVAFTSVSNQGPIEPFPSGWAPLSIVEVSGIDALITPATLAFADHSAAAAGRIAIASRYDASSMAWVAVTERNLAGIGQTDAIDISTSGQYALLLADEGPGAPQAPLPGQTLSGGTALVIPLDAAASGEVVPDVGRADDPTPARASVTISSETLLRSGTLLRGDFVESILLRSGGRAAPPDTAQDLLAYRSPADGTGGSLTAAFPIAASRTFRLDDVTEGTITVTLSRGAITGRTLTGATGGGALTGDGVRVFVPANAFNAATPMTIRRLEEATFPVPAPEGFQFIGGLVLDFYGTPALQPLTLTLEDAAALAPTGTQVVVAQVTNVAGRERLVAVAMGRVEGTAISTFTGLDGARMPGPRLPGRYGFYVTHAPLSVVTGTARNVAGRRDGHIIEIEGLAFVSLTDVGGKFAVLARPGTFDLRATGAASGDRVRIAGTTDVTLPEVVIGPTPPRVESIAVKPPIVEGNVAGPIVLLGKPLPHVVDDGSEGSAGNGNGQIEAGERVAVTLAVRNNGTIAAQGGTFALRIRGPNFDLVTPANTAIDALDPDQAVSIGPFVFSVPPGTQPSTLRYTLHYLLTSGTISTTIPFSLPLDSEYPNASVGTEVTIRFSEPIVVSATGGAITLAREDGVTFTAVEVRVLANAAGDVVTVRPLAPLRDDSRYRLTLTGLITDQDGRSLEAAPIIEYLRTEDRTPPAPVELGRIDASVPDGAGYVTVMAGPATVNPDDFVILLNDETGMSVLVTVRPDGSFQHRIQASLGQRLILIIRDRNDNQTRTIVDSFVRRDPITGAVVAVVMGASGGIVQGPDGVTVSVPRGAVYTGTEITVAKVAEPFVLPADLATDPAVSQAFSQVFTVEGRYRIDANIRQFASPVRLSVPAPSGAHVGDPYFVVRHQEVLLGGLLADVDEITGLSASENPVRTVTRLETLDSATVKDEGGRLVISTDSPPFGGILEPGVVTVLRAIGPVTLFAGNVRRGTGSGPAVSGALVRSLSTAAATAPFVAVTNVDGQFVTPDAAAGGPYAPGAVVSSRLDIFDPLFTRTIRSDVTGVVSDSAPPQTTIAVLDSNLVLPIHLSEELTKALGDVVRPTIGINLAGPSLAGGLSRVNDPISVVVNLQDDGGIEFVQFDVDRGNGFEPIPLHADSASEVTPTSEGLVKFRVTARDRSGNTATATRQIRAVIGDPTDDNPPPLTPLSGQRPVIRDLQPDEARTVAFDQGATLPFSEPLDERTVSQQNVRLFDPENHPVQTDVSLSEDRSILQVTPKRYLRMGACYRLEVGSSILDLNGEAFAGTQFELCPPPPIQIGKISLANVQDIELVGSDVLVAVSHPDPNLAALTDVPGELRAFRVRDEAGELMSKPQLFSTKPTRTNGRPLSITSDGSIVYVGNRFLGAVATAQPVFNPFAQLGLGSLSGSLVSCASNPATCLSGLSFVWGAFPIPPSNVEAFDMADPAQPQQVAVKELNHLVPFNANAIQFQSPSFWNPNTFPIRIASTSEGVGVVNFMQNVERFSSDEELQSTQVVERVSGYGQTAGRCTQGPRQGLTCSIGFVSSLSTGGTDCGCAPTTEFIDAGFFDDFVVSLEQGGLRTLSTAPSDDALLATDRTLGVLSMSGTELGARVGTVSHFSWTDSEGNTQIDDLAFVTGTDGQLTIVKVTDPAVPTQMSPPLQNTFGNMSFDECRGLAFVHGRDGDFHVVDFNDPTEPVELNRPSPDGHPFRVEGIGTRVPYKANANDVSGLFLASDTGIATIDIDRCTIEAEKSATSGAAAAVEAGRCSVLQVGARSPRAARAIDNLSRCSRLIVTPGTETTVPIDQPLVPLTATFLIANAPSDESLVAGDGSIVEWEIESGAQGRLSASRTQTSKGTATVLLTTGIVPGAAYRVKARLTSLVIDGERIEPLAIEGRTSAISVRPGSAASIEVNLDSAVAPADGTDVIRLTAIIRDSAGNAVRDGTAVQWVLDSSVPISFLSAATATRDGLATATIRGGTFPDSVALRVTADAFERVVPIRLDPVVLDLTANRETLDLTHLDTASIELRVTDPSGRSVADGTPVVWFSSAGLLTGQNAVSGGRAAAVLSPAGAQIGPAAITATVGNSTQGLVIEITDSGPLTVEAVYPVIVAGPPGGGVAVIDAIRGTVEVPFNTGTPLRVRGTPHRWVKFAAAGFTRVATFSCDAIDGDRIVDEGRRYSGIVEGVRLDASITAEGSASLAFSGNGRVTFSEWPEIFGAGESRVRLWLRPEALGPSVIVSKARQFSLELDANGVPHFVIETTAARHDITTSQPLRVGTWYQVTIRKSPTNASLTVTDSEGVVATSERTMTEGVVASAAAVILGERLVGHLDAVEVSARQRFQRGILLGLDDAGRVQLDADGRAEVFFQTETLASAGDAVATSPQIDPHTDVNHVAIEAAYDNDPGEGDAAVSLSVYDIASESWARLYRLSGEVLGVIFQGKHYRPGDEFVDKWILGLVPGRGFGIAVGRYINHPTDEGRADIAWNLASEAFGAVCFVWSRACAAIIKDAGHLAWSEFTLGVRGLLRVIPVDSPLMIQLQVLLRNASGSVAQFIRDDGAKVLQSLSEVSGPARERIARLTGDTLESLASIAKRLGVVGETPAATRVVSVWEEVTKEFDDESAAMFVGVLRRVISKGGVEGQALVKTIMSGEDAEAAVGIFELCRAKGIVSEAAAGLRSGGQLSMMSSHVDDVAEIVLAMSKQPHGWTAEYGFTNALRSLGFALRSNNPGGPANMPGLSRLLNSLIASTSAKEASGHVTHIKTMEFLARRGERIIDVEVASAETTILGQGFTVDIRTDMALYSVKRSYAALWRAVGKSLPKGTPDLEKLFGEKQGSLVKLIVWGARHEEYGKVAVKGTPLPVHIIVELPSGATKARRDLVKSVLQRYGIQVIEGL